MTDKPRLIEVAFPLKQTSIDSIHEKNVRHGHISTLHIWPARRPLAACRAAFIATILPDPNIDNSDNLNIYFSWLVSEILDLEIPYEGQFTHLGCSSLDFLNHW